MIYNFMIYIQWKKKASLLQTDHCLYRDAYYFRHKYAV